MRRSLVCACLTVLAFALGAPTKLPAQSEEKVGRLALPYFGVKQADNAFANSADYLGRRESIGKETRGQIEFARMMDICGPSIRWQEVELYDGRFGPTVTTQFDLDHQPSAAQIQWNSDIGVRFPKVNPGNVANDGGARWCSGTLIAADQLLTAGHCFAPEDDPNGWQTPSRRNESGANASWNPLTPVELAPLMHVNFNYQVDGNDPLRRTRPAVAYPIVKLLEYGPDLPKHLDYAIVEVGQNDEGHLPGEMFAITPVDASATGLAAAQMLTLLQHPNGWPKKIMAGPKKESTAELIYYDDLDTIGGSSGAGILAESGKVIGVHTNGGCKANGGGANRGVALEAVKSVSQIIK
jgi:hypothetical protein